MSLPKKSVSLMMVFVMLHVVIVVMATSTDTPLEQPYLATRTATPENTPTPDPDTLLASYNIVFVADETFIQSDEPLSPTNLIGENVQTVNTMADLGVDNDQQPIDVLIIHASAQEQVEASLVNTLYRDGTIIVVIDIPMEEYAEWLGDACLLERATAGTAPQPEGHFAYYQVMLVQTEFAQDAEAIKDYELTKPCDDYENPPPQKSGELYRRGGWGIRGLNTADDVIFFRYLLQREVTSREDAIYGFENRDRLTPTVFVLPTMSDQQMPTPMMPPGGLVLTPTLLPLTPPQSPDSG